MYKIFIVEDDPAIASALAGHLARWGYETAVARDFARVTEEFAAAAPQLVLMDITLPYYDGYHWCRELRRISKVPIVFLSSASDNLNQIMALSEGADDFIAKPCLLYTSAASIGPLPSMGAPSASTTRPRNPSPTGTETTRPVRRTASPSRMPSSEPSTTMETASSSKLSAMP